MVGQVGIMSERLDEAYIWVRQNLFSEWDEDGAWKIIEGCGPKYYKKHPSEWQEEGAYYGGECDSDNKHIYISPPYLEGKSDDEMHELIVHEIAHAISSKSHREEGGWPLEMRKAAERAKNVVEVKLADLIEGDRKSYEGVEEL